MDWGTELWDQHDVIEKHTQSGLDLAERYVKFVRERTEIEQAYAKQLRNLSKKYSKRGGKDDQDCRFTNHQSFQDILNELNDYAGQREVVAENMITGICGELTKYIQELKVERKQHLADHKKAQQNLEINLKHLENSKKRFAKEWAEAEKAIQQTERTEQDINSTKADVDKVKQQAHARTHTAEECRNDYAAQLQKFNKEQNQFYHSEIPSILNKLQGLDERRIRKLAEGYVLFAETEKQVLPIIGKCLEGMVAAGARTNEKQDSRLLIEQHKSGLVCPGDVEFEDYSHACPENNLNTPKIRPKLKLFTKKKTAPAEDFSHLPPEQRRKKLQQKIEDINKDLQKHQDQSDALEKMKGVYVKNSSLGDPASLEPQISQTAQMVARLKNERSKYESWLMEAGGGVDSKRMSYNNNNVPGPPASDPSDAIYDFEDDFDEDVDVPVSQCTALYTFQASSEGTISVSEGEQLSVMEEDKGDGWIRVQRANGDEGYIPTTYVKTLSLQQ